MGIPDIPDIYIWVNSRCWGQAYVSWKLVSTSSLAHKRRGRRTVFFKSWKGDESWNAAIYCNVFTDVTSVLWHKTFITHFLHIFYIKNKNGQQCFPKIVAYSSLAYIFCIFSKVQDLCVRIRQTGYGRNFFSNLGLNVWRNQPEIANHSNTVVKVRRFSTECTNAFIANVYIKSKKIVISYRMTVRPSFFLYESALFRCYNTILPVLGPFHRPQGWTGLRLKSHKNHNFKPLCLALTFIIPFLFGWIHPGHQ